MLFVDIETAYDSAKGSDIVVLQKEGNVRRVR